MQMILAHYAKLGWDATEKMTYLELEQALKVFEELKKEEQQQMEEERRKNQSRRG